jgi:hypothetical protein
VPGPYVHISSMWHTAEQLESGDYDPPDTARIVDGEIAGGYSVVLVGAGDNGD